MTLQQRKRVVIVGGGITGLAAARYLGQHAAGIAVTLIESDDRLGGKIATQRVDGFVIEGGPDSFLSYKPRGLGLCRELGLESRLHGTSGKVRRTYIMRGRKLHQLPEGLTGLIPSRFGPMLKTPLISLLGKGRMGLEYFIPPRMTDEDESLESFVSRRLGREVYVRMIEPLMSGIYAGDGNQLSLAATFPNLRKAELDYGGLIKSMLAARSKPAPQATSQATKRWPAFLTLESGLAEMVEKIEVELEAVDIRLRTRVTDVRRQSGQWGYQVAIEGEEPMTADAVILATPAFVTAELIDTLDPQAAEALRQIPYVSTATVSVVYPISQVPVPLDAHGYIVPRSEGRPVLACTWTSTKFPHRAPEGFALIRAFIGRAGQEDMLDRTDEELIQLVRDELRGVLGVTAPPQMHFVFRWPMAMPQYTLGHLVRVSTIERCFDRHPGLFFAGGAYRGIGIPDCIASGEKAATQAMTSIQTHTSAEVLTA
ncbi:MAG: protoporphyrinogen oxidase [Chloroflexi bacterium]|nr:protoporphyrinogen oxidase [Chloroflexota bacterium]